MLLCVGALSLSASVRALLELSLLELLYVGAPDRSLSPPLQLFFVSFFSFERTHAFVILILCEVWGDTDEVGFQQGTVCFRPRPRCPRSLLLSLSLALSLSQQSAFDHDQGALNVSRFHTHTPCVHA